MKVNFTVVEGARLGTRRRDALLWCLNDPRRRYFDKARASSAQASRQWASEARTLLNWVRICNFFTRPDPFLLLTYFLALSDQTKKMKKKPIEPKKEVNLTCANFSSPPLSFFIRISPSYSPSLPPMLTPNLPSLPSSVF